MTDKIKEQIDDFSNFLDGLIKKGNEASGENAQVVEEMIAEEFEEISNIEENVEKYDFTNRMNETPEEALNRAEALVEEYVSNGQMTEDNGTIAIAIFKNVHKKSMNLSIECIIAEGNLLINHERALEKDPFKPKPAALEQEVVSLKKSALEVENIVDPKENRPPIPFFQNRITPTIDTAPTPKVEPSPAPDSEDLDNTDDRISLKNRKLPRQFFQGNDNNKQKLPPTPPAEPPKETIKLKKKKKIPSSFFADSNKGTEDVSPSTSDLAAQAVANSPEPISVPVNEMSPTPTPTPTPKVNNNKTIAAISKEEHLRILDANRAAYEKQLKDALEKQTQKQKQDLEAIKLAYDKQMKEKVDNLMLKHKQALSISAANVEKQVQEKVELFKIAHEKEIAELKQTYENRMEERIEALIPQQMKAIETAKQNFEKKMEEKIDALTFKHKQAIITLKETHQKELDSLCNNDD